MSTILRLSFLDLTFGNLKFVYYFIISQRSMNGMNSIELWKQLVSYLKMLSNDEKKGLILDRKQIVKIFQQIRIWHNSRGNKEIWRLNREMIIGKLWEKRMVHGMMYIVRTSNYLWNDCHFNYKCGFEIQLIGYQSSLYGNYENLLLLCKIQ